MTKKHMAHESSCIQSNRIGLNTTIWQYVTVLPGAVIGCEVNICANCFIENNVIIGDRVTIKSGVYLWDGVRIEDDVFIGPNVTFTNDKFPRSKVYPQKYLETVVAKGASIGGGAVLLPGITIGAGAMVGAGAVVTRSVPPNAIVTGAPATITGYVDSEVYGINLEGELKSSDADEEKRVKPVGVGGVTLHELKMVRDIRGDLSVGEFLDDIPFKPNRYFLVFNVPSKKIRGEHAHYKCHQFLVCIKGSCAVVVDDGKSRCEVSLCSPNKGIYLPPMIWGVQYKYSNDAVLLVFASDHYEANDYIRSYSDFISIVG